MTLTPPNTQAAASPEDAARPSSPSRVPRLRRSPHRAAAAALATLAAVTAAALVVMAGSRSPQVEQQTPAQTAALARMEPYVELLSGDFEGGVALLPDTLVRDVTVSDDKLSASGVISLPVGDGSCAVIRVEIGPAYLLDGDTEALSVSGPFLLDASLCP